VGLAADFCETLGEKAPPRRLRIDEGTMNLFVSSVTLSLSEALAGSWLVRWRLRFSKREAATTRREVRGDFRGRGPRVARLCVRSAMPGIIPAPMQSRLGGASGIAVGPEADVDTYDDNAIEIQVARAAAGDDAAWQSLRRAIEPRLFSQVAQPRFLGPLSRREDDVRNVVVEVMARLCADGFRRLQVYVATRRSHPRLTFMTWLRVVAKRAGIDYVRGHPDHVDRVREAEMTRSGIWIGTTTLTAAGHSDGERSPVTLLATALEAARHASTLPPAQRRALELWLARLPFDAIARELGLHSAATAERMVHTALERVRMYFREEDP